MWGTQKETHLKISDQRYFLFFLINYKYFFHLSKILKEFSQLLNLLHSSGIIHSQSTPTKKILYQKIRFQTSCQTTGNESHSSTINSKLWFRIKTYSFKLQFCLTKKSKTKTVRSSKFFNLQKSLLKNYIYLFIKKYLPQKARAVHFYRYSREDICKALLADSSMSGKDPQSGRQKVSSVSKTLPV